MPSIPALHLLPASRFETPEILKKLASTSRVLAELKGTAGTIPRQSILINTLSIQEASMEPPRLTMRAAIAVKKKLKK